MRSLRFSLPLLPVLLTAALAPAAAGQGYTLQPGDLVIADTTGPFNTEGTIRILHRDGALEDVAVGAPLFHAAEVFVDRDGAILVSSWRGQFRPENGIYRIDPVTSAITRLNQQPLEDNFSFLRDGKGDLVVADGFSGLARIAHDGQVTWFSPSSVQFDVNIGIVLDYDGKFFVAEAPNPWFGNPAPGRVQSVDQSGARVTLVENPSMLTRPNGLALDRDGSLLATDAMFTPPIPPSGKGLYRVDRNGGITTLQIGWPLEQPKDVEVIGRGYYLIADPGDEAIWARKPGNAFHRVISEMDDKDPDNGKPVDRPFGIAVVPRLWLKTPDSVAPGATFTVEVQGRSNTKVLVAASQNPGPTPMSLFWFGDPQTSHLELIGADRYRGRTDAGGVARFQVTVPGGLPAGGTLHLQAFMDGGRDLSNYVALPVR